MLNNISKNKKVLVVDDYSDIRFYLKTILEKHGLVVLEAGNGKHAMELIQIHKDISLVLLDIMMPVMDGLQVLKQIKSTPETKHLLVCLLTAKNGDQDVQNAIKLGCDDYIVKPVDKEVLLSKVSILLKIPRMDSFKKIKTNFFASSSMNSVIIQFRIIELSEMGVVIESSHPLETGKELKTRCSEINQIIGGSSALSLMPYEISESGNPVVYHIKANFIGFSEQITSSIRQYTINRKGVKK